jgi:hypothetical protein
VIGFGVERGAVQYRGSGFRHLRIVVCGAGGRSYGAYGGSTHALFEVPHYLLLCVLLCCQQFRLFLLGLSTYTMRWVN